MDVSMTKGAKGSLALIYRAYKERLKSGVPKSQAVYFDGSTEDSVHLNPKVLENMAELKNAGLISCDIIGGIFLKDAAIVYMENKSFETIKEWLSFGAQFIP